MPILLSYDPVGIMDKSTCENPCRYPQGIEYVLVSGVIVVKEGKPKDAIPGKVFEKSISVDEWLS